KPSLRHPAPGRPARGIARELGHSLAVGGVPEKFLGWVHRPVLLMIRLRGTSPRGETVPRIGKAAASTGPVHARSSALSRRPIAPRNERIRSLAADTHPGGPGRSLGPAHPAPISTSGLRINGKRRERFLGDGLRPGVPAGWSGREQGRFHGSGFASGTMRNSRRPPNAPQEIKRWIRKMLTFAAASVPAFARARGPTPGTATAVRPRRRAQ